MKTRYTSLFASLVMTLAVAISAHAQVTLPDIAEATVRAGANENVDVQEITVGFERVKYVQDAAAGNTTACAKSYFKWDFTGQNPNTNADLTLSLTGVANSQLSAMRVWSLDQAYPDFTNAPGSLTDVGVLTWNNAQANSTNFDLPGVRQGTFQMLTNGPFTAHPVANFSAAGTTTVIIPAPWGNLIISNQMVLVICGTNNAALAGNNGYRMAINTTALVFPALVGAPPSITALPDVTVTAGQNSVTNSFTVADPAGNVATLPAATPAVDGAIVTSATVLGSGANQQIYVTAGTAGTTTVEVTIADENGDLAQRTFNVTVLPRIFPPTISTPVNTNTPVNTAVTVPFTIGDLSSPVSTLTVTGAVDAVSVNELASVSFAGSGTNRTVTVTPVTGADGVGIVDLSVTDTNGTTVTTSFAVMVLTNRVVFTDHFDYSDGSLFAGSDAVWLRRGNIQPVPFNVVSLAANIVSGANNDNAYAVLVGAPYATGSRSVIYITFTGNWVVVPTADSGSFVSLANNNTTSSPQACSIGSTPDIALDGNLNLRIANGGGYTVYPLDLVPGTPYKIAARYDVDSATATLWIDATNEVDTSVTNITATDITAPVAFSLVDLNQNGNTGNLALDDLKVSAVTRPQVNSISIVGSNVQIDFTAGVNDATTDFGVTSTTDLTSPFSDVSATITSLGGGVFRAMLPASGNQSFYRVKRQPFSF
ncbi:MAG TPA: hypothetical protein VNN22_13785 [Verrucomicrobiae bacterium]|nr:hypothetical protein [Verrucomicrobiae bacterium]